MPPLLSLVIPCYNEAGNLPSLVERCLEVVNRGDAEVILVDNGSKYETVKVLPALLAGHPALRSIRVEKNKGYGFGILSGLRAAQGSILAWTHADLQTDPADVLIGLDLFQNNSEENVFVKGARFGRPLRDLSFTWGMSAFEGLILRTYMWDINAQPTMFSRRFFVSWDNPPNDFSLDLYAFYSAVQAGLTIRRFPVHFDPRLSGTGHNETLANKLRYSCRTIRYSWELRQRLQNRTA